MSTIYPTINNKSLNNAHSTLLNNPMYRMSMSSLELFHSNFLACLFQENPVAFLKCFSVSYAGTRSDLVLVREYSLGSLPDPQTGKKKQYVTDIMVGIENVDGYKNNIKPLLIIENKIKSYPQEKQMKCQELLINKIQPNCCKIILSIFPINKDILSQTSFQEVLYSVLVGNIKQYYPNCNSTFEKYKDDYCQMLVVLNHALQKYTNIPNSPQLKKFLFPFVYKDLEEIGFMDVFRKYQASMLYYDGMNHLTNSQLGLLVGDNGISNKHAIASFYKTLVQGNGIDPELYVGIQIEDNQFRIVFGGTRIKKLIAGHKQQIITLPTVITDVWDEWFGANAKGRSRNVIANTGQHNDFCSYSDNFVYKYVDIYDDLKAVNQNTHPKITISQLLETGLGKVSKQCTPLSVKNVFEYFSNTNTIVPQIP